MPDTYDRTPITSPKWDHVRAQILAGESERSQRHAHIIDERRKVQTIHILRPSGRVMERAGR